MSLPVARAAVMPERLTEETAAMAKERCIMRFALIVELRHRFLLLRKTEDRFIAVSAIKTIDKGYPDLVLTA